MPRRDKSRSLTLGCCVDRRYGNGCTDATCMHLPAGTTCGDCVNLRRCVAFGVARRDQRVCDFFPRRFERGVCVKEPVP